MSGKTSVALYHIAQVQKTGRNAAYIDVEHSLNPVLAGAYGVDIENLIINQPQTGEEALDVTEALARTGLFGVIVVDSVSALVPESEAEADMAQQTIGLQARLMSKAMRKLTPAASEGECTIIFINQIREKIGGYGNPETTSGGRALPFYSSVRIEVRQNGGVAGLIKDPSGNVIGHQVKCKVVKNKTAVPYKEAIIDLYYGVGFNRMSEILTIALAADVVHQGGAWFTYGEDGAPNAFKVQGRANVELYMRENPIVAQDIENIVLERLHA